MGGKRQAGMAMMVRPWLETWIRLKRELTPKLRDGGREGREGRKPDGNGILYIPPAMTHRVDRERSIFGTELEDSKVVAQCDPWSAVEAQSTLGAWGLKRVKAAGWMRWKGPRKQLLLRRSF